MSVILSQIQQRRRVLGESWLKTARYQDDTQEQRRKPKVLGQRLHFFGKEEWQHTYPIRAQHRLGVTSTLRAAAGFLPGPDTLHSLEALSYGSQLGRMYKRLKGRRWALCANNFPSALEDSQQLSLWVEPVSGSSLVTPTQMSSPQFHRPRVGTPMREDSPER